MSPRCFKYDDDRITLIYLPHHNCVEVKCKTDGVCHGLRYYLDDTQPAFYTRVDEPPTRGGPATLRIHVRNDRHLRQLQRAFRARYDEVEVTTPSDALRSN